MTVTTQTSPSHRKPLADKASASELALRLAHAEHALLAFTSGQIDAVVDPDGKAYLLRPAQEHLRQKERRLQAAIDSIADVVTVVNRGGAILSQSRAVSRVLGYDAEKLVGTSIFEIVHQADLDWLYTAFFNVIEGFCETATAQFRLRARDGSYVLIEATAAKLRDPSAASVVFSLRPIATPRSGHGEPVRPGALDVSQPGEDRELALLPHPQRTPLMEALLGIAELEDELRIDSAKLPKQNDQLEARLLEEPVVFTKSGQLKVQLRLESVDAHEVARRVQDLCHRETAAVDVELLLYLRAEKNIVQADWARLLHVMCNLVRNAVECSTPGSTISISSTNDASGRLIFDLAAHGIAIESVLWPRIFDSFQPGDLSTPQLHGGIRHGLNIARRLVEAQGGTLTASSEGPGKGATFRLTLNTTPPLTAAAAIVPPEESGALATIIYEAVAKSLSDYSSQSA